MGARATAAGLCLAGLAAAVAVKHGFDRRRTGNEEGARISLLAAARAERARHERREPFARDLSRLEGLPPAMALGARAGYRFGAVALDETGSPLPTGRFAYYAVPEVYGAAGRLTLLVGEENRIYAKDAGANEPPDAWPASDPCAAGWTALGP